MASLQFVSVTDPSPAGFIYSPALSPTLLRGHLFCLYSDDIHRAEKLIEQMDGQAAGIVASKGSTLLWGARGRYLYRLVVPGELLPWLSTLAAPFLEMLGRLQLSDRRTEIASDIIWSVDMGLHFTYVSPAAVRIHQWTLDEWASLQVKDVVTPQSLERLNSVIAEELAREGIAGVDPNRSRVMEIEEYRKDGSVFPAELCASFLRDVEGRPIGITGVTRDISERKQAEAERRKLEAKLLQAHKLESVACLAGGIAHEINNMLTPIMGYGDMLTHDLSPDNPSRPMAQQIVVCARRCKDLVAQLLAFARKQTLEIKPLDLAEVVDAFLERLRRTLRENVTIQARFDQSTGWIMGDRTQIEQVILNLALNAQDAMPSGGALRVEIQEVTLEADTWGEQEVKAGRYLMMLMADTGEGMERETLEKAFDPFFSTRGVGKGMGLGLSTVFGIVSQHGGFIRVSSEPGRGTVVRLYFPCTSKVLSTEGFGPPLKKAEESTATVLIVEDEEQVRAMAVKVLRRQGYTVLETRDAPSALELINGLSGPLDLLLTDVVLPNMSGVELWNRVQGCRHGLKVLFMSGYPADVVSDQGLLGEGMPYLQKPFSIRDLIERVKSLLGDR